MVGQNVVEIPDGRFEGLAITCAKLSGNRIRQLRTNLFVNISKLEVLYLNENNLIWIDSEAFRPIASSLIHLELKNNRLGEMKRSSTLTAALMPLRRLDRLNLARNGLSVSPDLTMLSQLTELDLSHNELKSVRDEMRGGMRVLLPVSLVNLVLEGNQFVQITSLTFAGLVNLKHLNLEDNSIAKIEAGAFVHAAEHLVTLKLARNYLKHIPSDALFSLLYLERLELASQKVPLKTVRDFAFDRLDNERSAIKIDLSKNQIGRF